MPSKQYEAYYNKQQKKTPKITVDILIIISHEPTKTVLTFNVATNYIIVPFSQLMYAVCCSICFYFSSAILAPKVDD